MFSFVTGTDSFELDNHPSIQQSSALVQALLGACGYSRILLFLGGSKSSKSDMAGCFAGALDPRKLVFLFLPVSCIGDGDNNPVFARSGAKDTSRARMVSWINSGFFRRLVDSALLGTAKPFSRPVQPS